MPPSASVLVEATRSGRREGAKRPHGMTGEKRTRSVDGDDEDNAGKTRKEGEGEGIHTPCTIFGIVDVGGKASEELGVGAEDCLVKE